MAQQVSNAFIRQYEREVHQAYQRRGSFLRPTVRVKTGVKGYSTTFQTTGRGMAGTKGRHGLVPVMNIDHDPVECPVLDFYAGDWVDQLDELKINIDERMVLTNAGAWALGRKTDDLIFDALDQSGNAPIVIATGSSNAVKNALITTVETLRAREVPDDGNIFAVVSWRMWSQMLTIDEFVSSDYVNAAGRPFATQSHTGNGKWKDWMGVKWSAQNGLPKATDTVTNFIYHKTAVGHAVGKDVTADVTWHGDRAAHFINNMMSQGSCMIDAEGIQPFTLDETAALPTAASA